MFDPSHEPAERDFRSDRAEDPGAGAQQVKVAGQLTARGVHERQVRDDFPRMTDRSFGDELGESVLAQDPGIHGVEQAARDSQPGVADQVLAGELNAWSGVGQGTIRHRKGDPSNGYFRASRTLFPSSDPLFVVTDRLP